MIGTGAPLEERTPTGLTALARAIVSCRPAVVEALLRAGANPNATDNDGRTMLTWARMSCPGVEPLLRKAGAR
jgi:ankyrin repeat protein